MILWGPGQHINERELEKIIGYLGRTERNQVMMAFRADINEERKEDYGIDRAEFERGIAWLRENKRKHNLDDGEISKLVERAEPYFKR